MAWTAKEVAKAVGGKLYGAETAKVSGCTVDSRTVGAGNLFFAFAGAQADGHAYLQAAWEKGATVAVGVAGEAEKWVGSGQIPPGKALITVGDSLVAIQRCARARLQGIGAKVVSVTGSNGKTTTKDMVAAVLSRRYRVYASKGNHNNELGLPLTILNAPDDTEIMVLEMGMRGKGQIKGLCEIAPPRVGVITNIGTTHMELLGCRENIARAKWELIEALPEDGCAVLNGEDEWSVKKSGEARCPVRFYGLEGKYRTPDVQGYGLNPVGAMGTEFTVQWRGERATGVLPLPGKHNVLDALAALTVGTVFSIPLREGWRGLAALELSAMRLEVHSGVEKSTLISDVYNANPVSMQASLRVLKDRGGSFYTIAVLGDMYELGDLAEEGHRQVGRTVSELRINALVTVGPLAREIGRGALEAGYAPERIFTCSDPKEGAKQVRELLAAHPEAWVLIKGSRGMKMEGVTAALALPACK